MTPNRVPIYRPACRRTQSGPYLGPKGRSCWHTGISAGQLSDLVIASLLVTFIADSIVQAFMLFGAILSSSLSTLQGLDQLTPPPQRF